MADIIEKIGKYFADQEAQMREMYAHAAFAAASSAPTATNNKSTVSQPPVRVETDTGKSRNVDRRWPEKETNTTPSLLRRRLSLPKESELEVENVVSGVLALSTDSKQAFTMDSAQASTKETTSTDSLPRKLSGGKGLKKKKKKKVLKRQEDEELKRQRAAEGLVRAQERAKRIQQEKLMQEKQVQLERDANAARLAEEMRKIEAIRRKGKQFAIRLRPQSAPTTPQGRTTLEAQSENRPTSARGDDVNLNTIQVAPKPKQSFLDGLELEVYDQMMAEKTLLDAIHETKSREDEEWTRLQLQIKKTQDRNAIKQERVNSMMKRKEELLKEISENQGEAEVLRHERHQLEEKSKRERQLKQREAEREIHARLRREESQRLVDEERAQNGQAAEARAKARMRVHSRAALLKRVLHGCDIRPATHTSTNQEDTAKTATTKPPHTIDTMPELAEFEEDGLAGEVPEARDTLPSPTKVVRPPLLQTKHVESSFMWKVPVLALAEIHTVLRAELDYSCDSA